LPPKARVPSCVFFKYLSFRTASSPSLVFKLPLVNIRIQHNGIAYKTLALIDSGATTTFLPTDAIGILNMDPKETGHVTGAGGTFEAWKDHVDLIQVCKGSHIYCEMKHVPVQFPRNGGAVPYAVLGRDSIFKKCDVTFREDDQKVVFKHIKP